MLYLELAMFAAGLATLATGRVAVLKGREVEGIPARLAGLVLAAPLPLAFCIGFVIGARAAAKNPDANLDGLRGMLFLVDLLLVIGCGTLALVISLFGGESEDERRYAAESMWLEDPDAARILYPGYKPSKARMVEMTYGKGKRRRPKKRGNGPLIACLVIVGLMLAVAGYLILDFLAAPARPAAQQQNGNAPPPLTEAEQREQASKRQEAQEQAEQRAALAADEKERAEAERYLTKIDLDEKVLRDEAERKERVKRDAEARQAELDRRERERVETAAREFVARLERPLAEITVPAPKAGSGQALAARVRGEGLTWADLKLDPPPATPAPGAPKPKTPAAPPAPKPKAPPTPGAKPEPAAANSTPVAGMCWSADGNSFVVATTAGLVRRVGHPDFEGAAPRRSQARHLRRRGVRLGPLADARPVAGAVAPRPRHAGGDEALRRHAAGQGAHRADADGGLPRQRLGRREPARAARSN